MGLETEDVDHELLVLNSVVFGISHAFFLCSSHAYICLLELVVELLNLSTTLEVLVKPPNESLFNISDICFDSQETVLSLLFNQLAANGSGLLPLGVCPFADGNIPG